MVILWNNEIVVLNSAVETRSLSKTGTGYGFQMVKVTDSQCSSAFVLPKKDYAMAMAIPICKHVYVAKDKVRTSRQKGDQGLQDYCQVAYANFG